nr:retrovirus-related Pol polyprotein from transposon TNT 1-94 [Tanacetum cinerariifolium]
MLLMQAQKNGVALDEEHLLFITGGQDNTVDENVDKQHVQDLALNVDNLFQADECDAFDSDVDEAPTAQTMFKANLSSADPVSDKACPSYDSDILSEVHDHDHYQDAVCEHHEVHEMHDDLQPNYIVDSHTDDTRQAELALHGRDIRGSCSQWLPFSVYHSKENGVALDEEQLLFITGGQDNTVDEDVDEQPVQDLALNVDNVFQADECDAFDSDVDEAPIAQNMFMADLSSADPYVKDNAVPVVQSNVSAIPNDAHMMISNDMHEPPVQHVSVTTYNNVVGKSLTAELATYKEQVELNNREVHLDYLKHLKESVATLREIVEEAK